MLGSKLGGILIEANHNFDLGTLGTLMDGERYQRLVGKLIYLSHTGLDIAFVVRVVSQFKHNPNEDRLATVMVIFSYLEGTPRKGC